MVMRMNSDELKRHLANQPDDSRKHDALYEAQQRVQQLEQLNSVLAEQLDRMGQVTSAVLAYVNGRRDPTQDRIALLHKVQVVGEWYQQQMAKLAKESE